MMTRPPGPLRKVCRIDREVVLSVLASDETGQHLRVARPALIRDQHQRDAGFGFDREPAQYFDVRLSSAHEHQPARGASFSPSAARPRTPAYLEPTLNQALLRGSTSVPTRELVIPRRIELLFPG